MKGSTLTQKRARALRRELTDAERILWSRLKGRQLGWQFRAQHPVGPYIADFACVKLKLILEIDGATHGSADERSHDAQRTRFMEEQGWGVVRFWNDEVYRNLDGVVGWGGGEYPLEASPSVSRVKNARSTSPGFAGGGNPDGERRGR